jgi:hypothetical protein
MLSYQTSTPKMKRTEKEKNIYLSKEEMPQI